MNHKDYPALWQASNSAAANYQRIYLLWVGLHLTLLAGTGIVASWNPMSATADRTVAIAVGSMMLAALLIGLGLRAGKPDDAWFRARAFAENSKSSAWRFMMKSRPTDRAEEESEEKAFVEELQQIRARFPQVERYLSRHDPGGEELTAKMREVRALNLTERLAFYRTHRLHDQIEWYRSHAMINARAESYWFVTILVVEGLAIAAAVWRMLDSHPYNPTGAVAALAACLVAWVQTKRFSDLANTYGVASRDLNGLNSQVEHVRDEVRLQAFVNEVETAVSREHRVWVARRFAL